MTSNGNFDGESPTLWLQSVGFHRNPFSLPFAENQPTDMFQQTYFVADELEQLMLHEEKSVAFLAPYGGGKTAARRYTQFRWEEQYPHAFITVYENFTAVVEQLPDVTLSTHRESLLAATAESFWTYISHSPKNYWRFQKPGSYGGGLCYTITCQVPCWIFAFVMCRN